MRCALRTLSRTQRQLGYAAPFTCAATQCLTPPKGIRPDAFKTICTVMSGLLGLSHLNLTVVFQILVSGLQEHLSVLTRASRISLARCGVRGGGRKQTSLVQTSWDVGHGNVKFGKYLAKDKDRANNEKVKTLFTLSARRCVSFALRRTSHFQFDPRPPHPHPTEREIQFTPPQTTGAIVFPEERYLSQKLELWAVRPSPSPPPPELCPQTERAIPVVAT